MQVLIAGFQRRCPACGKGAIFKSYLKQHDYCPVCNESFQDLSADDGPAWLSIVIATHIIGPVILHLALNYDFSYLMFGLILIALSIPTILLVLPCTKGIFIAMLWRNKKLSE